MIAQTLSSLPCLLRRCTDAGPLLVDHRGAAYPVVADPKFTWGIFSGTLYFTRGETRRATHVSGLLSVVAGACAASAITGVITDPRELL